MEEIKKHSFFKVEATNPLFFFSECLPQKGIDWDRVRETQAPIVPDLKDQYDTKYFDDVKDILLLYSSCTQLVALRKKHPAKFEGEKMPCDSTIIYSN